jgi:L-threonylcarbamoyladenylate synthase
MTTDRKRPGRIFIRKNEAVGIGVQYSMPVVARALSVDPQAPEAAVLSEALRVLREGGVLAYPTETFYGLAVDARSAEACRRLLDLKGRPEDKAFPCIVSGVGQLEEAAARVEAPARELARRFWPGPLTLVVAARRGLAASSADGGIAIRASSVRLARDLAEGLGGPITATSANRSGEPAAITADKAASSLDPGLDLILDGGPCPGGLPSTIVDVREMPPKLLREGRVPFAEVMRVFESS